MLKRPLSSLLRNPFVIALSVMAIAYSGYVFGQWLHRLTN